MDIEEIVIKYLKDNNYDGLYNLGECACLIDDLFPCMINGGVLDCKAGYKMECDCGDHDYHVGENEL